VGEGTELGLLDALPVTRFLHPDVSLCMNFARWWIIVHISLSKPGCEDSSDSRSRKRRNRIVSHETMEKDKARPEHLMERGV
jgi:hypothetical protein